MNEHKIQFILKMSILQMNKYKSLPSHEGAIYAKVGHSPSGKTSSLTSPEGA